MPSPTITRSTTRRSNTARQSILRKTNRGLSSRQPQSELYGSDNDSDATLSEVQPFTLDDPWRYTFEAGSLVWVRTAGGNWHSGRVLGRPKAAQTRDREGLYYHVQFNERIRKWFAPLNGEIKPNTSHIRQLLKEGGWLDLHQDSQED